MNTNDEKDCIAPRLHVTRRTWTCPTCPFGAPRFSAWSAWHPVGGCSGLCQRHRWAKFVEVSKFVLHRTKRYKKIQKEQMILLAMILGVCLGFVRLWADSNFETSSSLSVFIIACNLSLILKVGDDRWQGVDISWWFHVTCRHPGHNNECGNPCSGHVRETIAEASEVFDVVWCAAQASHARFPVAKVRLDDPLCYPSSCVKSDEAAWFRCPMSDLDVKIWKDWETNTVIAMKIFIEIMKNA